MSTCFVPDIGRFCEEDIVNWLCEVGARELVLTQTPGARVREAFQCRNFFAECGRSRFRIAYEMTSAMTFDQCVFAVAPPTPQGLFSFSLTNAWSDIVLKQDASLLSVTIDALPMLTTANALTGGQLAGVHAGAMSAQPLATGRSAFPTSMLRLMASFIPENSTLCAGGGRFGAAIAEWLPLLRRVRLLFDEVPAAFAECDGSHHLDADFGAVQAVQLARSPVLLNQLHGSDLVRMRTIRDVLDARFFLSQIRPVVILEALAWDEEGAVLLSPEVSGLMVEWARMAPLGFDGRVIALATGSDGAEIADEDPVWLPADMPKILISHDGAADLRTGTRQEIRDRLRALR